MKLIVIIIAVVLSFTGYGIETALFELNNRFVSDFLHHEKLNVEGLPVWRSIVDQDESFWDNKKVDNTQKRIVIRYYEYTLQKQAYWEALSIPYLEKIGDALDDSYFRVLEQIIIHLNRPDSKMDGKLCLIPRLYELKAPPRKSFFYGVYMGTVGGDKKLGLKYLYYAAVGDGGSSLFSAYRELLEQVFPGDPERFARMIKSAEALRYDSAQKLLECVEGTQELWDAYWLGCFYYSGKQYDKAAKWILKAADSLPGIAFKSAEKFEAIGDYRTSEKLHEIAIQEGDIRSYLILAILLADKESGIYDPKRAIVLCRKGCANNLPVCRFLLAVLLAEEKTHTLEDILKMVGAITPDEERSYFENATMGTVYESYKENALAVEFFLRADRIQHGLDIRPKKELFDLYLKLKKTEQAESVMKEILSLIDDPARKREEAEKMRKALAESL